MNTQLNEQLRGIKVPPRPVHRLKSVFEILADVDERVRRSVLFHTVSGLNAMVIFNTLAHCRKESFAQRQSGSVDARTSLDVRNEQDEANRVEHVEHADSAYTSPYDGMTAEEIARHGNGGDLESNIGVARQIHALRDFFLDELVALSNVAPDMSYASSLKFMSNRAPRAKSSDEKLEMLAKIVDMPDIVTVDTLRMMQMNQSQRSNDQLLEFADIVLNTTDRFDHGCKTEDEAAAAFDALSQAKQLQVVQTIWRSALRAIKQALANDNIDTIADALMLKTVKEDTERLMEQYKAARAQELAA